MNWPTDVETATLTALCDTLLPRLDYGLDVDYRGGGIEQGIDAAMVGALTEVSDTALFHFRLFLKALETPAFIRLFIGVPKPFTACRPRQREAVLQAMAVSPVAPVRKVFAAAKRLSTFLFYSLPDRSGRNPLWDDIGYQESTRPPVAPPPPLRLTRIEQPTVLDADVCIIGSGAGGGVMAAELAAVGWRVVVLEASFGDQAAEFGQLELPGMQRLYLGQGLLATHDLGLSLLAGAALGGGTAINWQTSVPLRDSVRDEWADRSGCAFFTEESFDRSVAAVMQRLHVSTAESEVNANNDCLRRGCDALGLSRKIITRNAHGCETSECGYCTYGCRTGGKQSTTVTFLQDAQQGHDTVIVPECRAERVLIEQGRVTGVLTSGPVTVRAPRVVIAAGALHTPLILQRSGVSLAEVGRNLFLHPVAAAVGIYPDRIDGWRGPPQTVMCDQFSDLSGPYGFLLESCPAHPGLIALALPWHGGQEHRELMLRAAHMASIIVLTRDGEPGQVSAGRDGRPIVHYRVGAREQVFLKEGLATALRVHAAAGAQELLTLHARRHHLTNLSEASVERFCQDIRRSALARNWSVLFSAHQMGTARMGRSPRTAVCDARGQVFGVHGLYIGDSSAFPASAGINPMITIMALAHHTAQAIKES